jgi:sugar phosphate isomerase/epimerase
MKVVAADGRTTHLGYCFNVLPGETAAALIEQVRRYCGPVRRRLGVRRLGVGLWIAQPAAAELVVDRGARSALIDALVDEGLYCFTLNGFPFGGFHAPRVKERVFLPGWDDPERVAYTRALAELLVELLPDDVATGSISTVPLGPASVHRARAMAGIAQARSHLDRLAATSGRAIALAIEPEPGAAIERASALATLLAGQGTTVGACLDTCHAAVVGEDPAAAWAALADAGVPCVKIQISSALVVPRPDLAATRAALAAFDEPRFLHQVRCDGGGAMDLPEALAGLDTSSPWRVHFHVPVHRDDVGSFGTTQAGIAPVLRAALAAPGPLPHLEVETYTWSVLPAGERPEGDEGLVDGIARELRWTIDTLATLGVRPA